MRYHLRARHTRRHARSHARAKHGFSIPEIVIAMLILGAALVPIYSIFVNSSKAAASSKYAYMAAQVARETMEELRQIPFDKLEEQASPTPKAVDGPIYATTSKARTVGGGTDANSIATASSPSYPEDYKRIKRTIKIEKVDGTTLPASLTGPGTTARSRLYKVSLDVFWEETGGAAEKSRPGLQHYVTFIGQHSVDPEVPE